MRMLMHRSVGFRCTFISIVPNLVCFNNERYKRPKIFIFVYF